MFWVIHLTETDGDVALWPCESPEKVAWYVDHMKLHMNDYAVIEGNRLKDFYQNSIDYNLKSKRRK